MARNGNHGNGSRTLRHRCSAVCSKERGKNGQGIDTATFCESDRQLRPARAGMQKHVARHMAEAIKSHIPDSDGWNVLEIGCGTGLFTREYLRGFRPGRLLLNDICPEVEPYLSGLPTASPIHFQACDAETLRFPAGQHLIVSCSAVQWFERPERFLSGCRELLTTGGYIGLQYIRPAERKGSSLAHFRNVALPLIRGTAPDAFGRIPNRVQPGRNPTFHIPLTLGCAETFAGHRRDRPTKPEMDQRPTGRFLPTLP